MLQTKHSHRRLLPSRRLGLLASALLATAACADQAAEPTRAGETTVATQLLAAQDGVDALLAATTDLDTVLARGSMPPHAELRYRALERTVNELALAAQDLRAATGELSGADRDAIRRLSMRSAQLAPQLRALKRSLQAEQDAAITTSVARVRVAARSLVGETSALDALTDPRGQTLGEAIRQGLGDSYRNGPLWPGSAIYVLDEGHIDAVDAAFEDGELGITIHDESIDPDVERDPRTTVMVAKATAQIALPDERFAFIGPVGALAWILPENQLDAEAAGILWPGLATEEIEAGVFVSDQVQLRFKQVIGPNGFSLFESPQDESSPPVVLVDSENGLPDVVTLPAGIHKHANWAFESAGVYLVRVDVRGRLAVAGEPWVTSSTATLKFVVLP